MMDRASEGIAHARRWHPGARPGHAHIARGFASAAARAGHGGTHRARATVREYRIQNTFSVQRHSIYINGAIS